MYIILMFRSASRRIRRWVSDWPWHIMLQLRSTPTSYELLPTPFTLPDNVKQRARHPIAFMLLFILLLLVFVGVSTGVIFESSDSAASCLCLTTQLMLIFFRLSITNRSHD